MGNSVYNNAETGYGASSEKGSFNGYTSVRKVDSKNINFKVGGFYPNLVVRGQQGKETIKNGLGSYSITSTSRENYNVIGSPYISSDYIVSNFSGIDFTNTGYVALNTPIPEVIVNNWEIVTKIHTPKYLTTSYNTIFHIENHLTVSLKRDTGRLCFWFYYNTSSHEWQIYAEGNTALAEDTDYWIKLSMEGNVRKLYYSLDGQNFIEEIENTEEATTTFSSNRILNLGWNSTASFEGSIDLKETYININDSKWKNFVDIGNISYGAYKLFVPEEDGLYFEKGNYYRQPRVPLTGTNIVGSLNRSWYYLNGFSANNYISLPYFDTSQATTLECTFKVNLEGDATSNCIVGNSSDNYDTGGFVWRTDDSSRLLLWCTTSNQAWTTSRFDTGIDLTAGMQYLSLIFTNNTITFLKSLDGVNWTTGNSVSTLKFTSFSPRVGITGGNRPFKGGIWVNESRISVNGKVIWTGIQDGTIWEDTSVLPIKCYKYSTSLMDWEPYHASYLGNMTINSNNTISDVYEEPANSMNTTVVGSVKSASIVDTLEDSSLDIYKITRSSASSTISLDVVPGIYLITLIGGGGGGAQTDGGTDQYADTGWAWHYGHNAGAGGKFKGYASIPSTGKLQIVVGAAGGGGGGWGGDSYAIFTPTGGSAVEIARARGGHGGRPDGSSWGVAVPGGTVTYNSNYVIQVLQADQGAGGGSTWAIHI